MALAAAKELGGLGSNLTANGTGAAGADKNPAAEAAVPPANDSADFAQLMKDARG
ncbi:hypothetical protein [Streptomyces hokutonensis]|uniref:hypothetical protein n=1 Tax=Streptomyces hokutonensis TaxID=1306990 RepID=UPI00037B0F4D|nr:hypothetical protein [Streptomyces hokutonensis]